MIETLNNLDTQLFHFINGHHCTVMDWVMWVMSQHWCWAVVIVAAFCLLTLRHEPRRWWVVLVGIGFCFLLADQGSVLLFKNTVCRLRPCHALEGVRMFHTRCGGQYGFVSSHAANAFAVGLFFVLRYWNRIKRRWPLLLLMLWVLATSYSRVYLGKHYPGDVLCGALFGVLVGWLVWWATKNFEKKFHFNETKK